MDHKDHEDNENSIQLVIEEMPRFFPEYLFYQEVKNKYFNQNNQNNLNNYSSSNSISSVVPFKRPMQFNNNSMFFNNTPKQFTTRLPKSTNNTKPIFISKPIINNRKPNQFSNKMNINFSY